MTEQEFRELTAYQPPSPPPKAHGPAVASVAAAVAAVKTPMDNAAQEPPLPEPIAQVPPPPQAAEPVVQMPIEAQIQTTAQAHAQAQGQHYSPPPQQAEFSITQNPIQPTQAEPPAPAAPSVSFEMVPQQKHEELMEQYAHLNDRFKRLVEERDALSRQVSELRHTVAEQSKDGALQGRDYKEEIRLLGKLIDDEQSLRVAARPGDELYARHDRLVNVFLNIVARVE
ncbi:MAG: hypothetical protein LBL05_09460 [Synergistaceae bacterium]|jgi:hypothetical protein|nr:hypothetical protein [Synergistaceae bacterium]